VTFAPDLELCDKIFTASAARSLEKGPVASRELIPAEDLLTESNRISLLFERGVSVRAIFACGSAKEGELLLPGVGVKNKNAEFWLPVTCI
jgi:hypothetical protein